MTGGNEVEASPRRWRWVLAGILLLAATLRSLGPYLQQSTGDSLHYAALAMKLSREGPTAYALRGVDTTTRSLDDSNTPHILILQPAAAGATGSILQGLLDHGLTPYAKPLHLRPYGYPALLALVQRLTGHQPSDPWELVHCQIEPMDLIRYRPPAFLAVQWRWLIPSLLASLLVIVVTWQLTRRWCGESAALWAAFLMAVHPLDILVSQRIWADAPLELAGLLSVSCGYMALRRNAGTWALLSGIAMGAAYLFKPTAVNLLLAVGGVELFRRMWNRSAQDVPAVSMRLAILFTLGLFLALAHWLYLEWRVEGSIFSSTLKWPTGVTDAYSQRMALRPHSLILNTVGVASLCPLLLVGWLSIREPVGRWLMAVVVLFAVILILLNGREYRLLLPVIPLMAMAAGMALTRLAKRTPLLVVLLALLQTRWALYLTDRFVWRNWGEIMFPF